MKKAILKYGPIAGGILVFAAAILLLLLFNRTVEVPYVTGQTLSQAREILESEAFKVLVTSEYSDTVAKDIVISQSIKGGDKAKYGAGITLVVSAGKERITMPDLKGLTADEAKACLENLGLSVVIKESFSDTVGLGKVAAQSVAAGDLADKGASVTLTVSKGPDLVTVPDVGGMTAKEAEKALRAAGLQPKTDIQCSDSVPEGYVISQSAEAGRQISRNSTVSVMVSVGVANKAGTTPANAVQHSRVTSQGDWLYFGVKGGVYKMRKDGTDRQRLCDNGGISLNVVGEWLYYTDGTTGGIFKIKINGTEQTKLSSVTSYMVYVEDGWIYYTSKFSGGQIYKMRTDGSSVTQLTSDTCSEYFVYGQYIYYVNRSDNMVYRCGTDGSGRRVLCSGFAGICLSLVEDRVVVEGQNKFLCVDLDGKDFYSFGANRTQPYLVTGHEGWIYYLELDYRTEEITTAFYKVRPDGSEKTKIYDYEYLNHSNAYLNVVDGWLYFQNEHDNDALYRVSIDGATVQAMQ